MEWRGSELKGVLSRGLCCVRVNSALQSLLCNFTHTQNAPAESRRRYQMKFCEKSKPSIFFLDTACELDKIGYFFQSVSILAIRYNSKYVQCSNEL